MAEKLKTKKLKVANAPRKPRVGSANWKPLTVEQYSKLSPEERVSATAELKEHLAHLATRVSRLKVELEGLVAERIKK